MSINIGLMNARKVPTINSGPIKRLKIICLRVVNGLV